jgi:hypothetical protein
VGAVLTLLEEVVAREPEPPRDAPLGRFWRATLRDRRAWWGIAAIFSAIGALGLLAPRPALGVVLLLAPWPLMALWILGYARRAARAARDGVRDVAHVLEAQHQADPSWVRARVRLERLGTEVDVRASTDTHPELQAVRRGARLDVLARPDGRKVLHWLVP